MLSTVFFSIYVSFLATVGFALTPQDLLQKADAIRNPSESYQMQVEVTSGSQKNVFDIYLKNNDKTLIVTREPTKDRGRNMLMLDRDFHSYVPNLKRSVRLSLSQKLLGQVANGDISRTRWYGDYTPSLESTQNGEIQLFLKGEKKNLTYANIRLWIDAKTNRPLRAEYLNLKGDKALKKARFEDYKQLEGKTRPGKIVIEDESSQASTIQILSMKSKTFEDSFFTVRNMETFK